MAPPVDSSRHPPVPQGQRLPVVAPAQDRPAQSADRPGRAESSDGAVMAVPVRRQPEPREALNATVPEVQRTEEGDFWHQTVQQLVAAEAINAMVRELALQSQLVGRDTGHWLLRVERESLNQPASRERLQNALAAAGHGVTLGVEVGRVTDSPARRNALAAAERQRGAEAAILNDPFVQSMMREFGAKIVPGSIKSV